jgi:hypothetical protein
LILPFFLYFTKIIFHENCKLLQVKYLSTTKRKANKAAKVVFLKDFGRLDLMVA